MNWDRVLNIAGSLIVLAGVAVAVSNWRGTSNIIRAVTGGFASSIRAATAPASGGAA